MIRYACPQCGAKLESPDSLVGQVDKCPICGFTCPVPRPKSRKRWALLIAGGGASLLVGVALAFVSIFVFAMISDTSPWRSPTTQRLSRKATTTGPSAEIEQSESLPRAELQQDRQEADRMMQIAAQATADGRDLLEEYQQHRQTMDAGERREADKASRARPRRLLATVAKRHQRLEGVVHDISISGVIGEDFTARECRSHLGIADRFSRKADLIVLYINSPGGSVSDLESIITAMVQSRKRFIAVVDEKALSAAAVVALACDTIYMSDGARMGGATPYWQKSDGDVVRLPPAVEEKQFSAMRALVRIAARRGGHSTDLAEAMVDPDIQITMTKAGGTPVLQRDGNGSIVSRRGEVLTLTTEEAIDCGLARSVGEFRTDLRRGLVSKKLVFLSSLADDPLEEFIRNLNTHYYRTPLDNTASYTEAENAARTWAKETQANAAWLRRPLPIVVHHVMQASVGPYLYYVDGKSLLGSASVFAGIRGKPAFMATIRAGDIITITGVLEFDSLYIDRYGRITLNFSDCQCAIDR